MADKSVGELFEHERRILEGQPQLSQSYGKFLQDWEEYNKLRQVLEKGRKSRDYLIFGASFRE